MINRVRLSGLLAWLCFMPIAVSASDNSQTLIIPGAIHLEGVGSVYGAGAGIKAIGESDYNIFVAIAGGDADVFGLGITDVPLLNGRFSYIYGQADEVLVETQYQRGSVVGRLYEQQISGDLHRFALTHDLSKENMSSTLALSLSSVALDGYANENGVEIAINATHLHDIETLSVTAGLEWDNRVGTVGLKTGSKVGASLTLESGRTAQSDQGILELKASRHLGISDEALVSFYVNLSHAFIVSQATAFDSIEEVSNTLDAQCDGLSNTEQQNQCRLLEQDLVSYITDSNNKGTAKPVGGSQGLRSYQESFFRGANSLVEGIELQWQLPKVMQFGETTKLQWVAFVEGAQITDDVGKLLSDSRYSVGTGLRAYVGGIPLRAEFAHGEEGNAFLLNAGLVF
ncbi:MAG: hypothetical protein KUG82_01585 [Pseudomonadales bacterium]|nr:hypothetical protein [Pseudomonadales bacterium]